MAGIRNAREEFEETRTYLTNEELVDRQTEFCVLSATYEASGQFGPTWTLMIVYLDETGEHVKQQLYLSAGTTRNGTYRENAYRRWFFGQKATYPIHHVILTQGIGQNGRKFNDIDDSPSSIDPCPCMTGDWIASTTVGLLLSPEVVDAEIVDRPVSETERQHLLEGIYLLSTKMGWPVDKETLEQKSFHDLHKLYKNWGALAAKQEPAVQR